MLRVRRWSLLGLAAGTAVLLAGCGAGATGVGGAGGSAAARSAPGASSAGAAVPAGSPLHGTYVIVGASSTASYTAHETFLGTNSPFTPVGTTSSIQGDIVLQDGKIRPSTIQVDLRTRKTDSAMRDHHIQQTPLETATYPYATFALAGTASPLIAEGQTVSLQVPGTMTIHGTSKPVTFAAQIAAQGQTLKVTGTAGFNFSYFNLQPPDIPGFVAVQQGLQIGLDVTATAG